MATSPDEAIRDGKRAIDLAKKACEGTTWKQPHIISTLAAGYAETGDFAEARKYSKQAVESEGSSPEVKTQLQGELASYESEKPWRERQEQEDQPLEADRDPDMNAGQEADEQEAAKPQEPAAPRKKRRPFD